MEQLVKEFTTRVVAAVDECRSFGYYPHNFESMLQSMGAVALAKRFAVSGEIQTGLKKLRKMNRLYLSIESIMLEPQFEPLFTAKEREAARFRLDFLR